MSNQEGQIISALWKWLCQHYGINGKLSLAQHPETDSLIKNVNKVMKNYMQAYINYVQDN